MQPDSAEGMESGENLILLDALVSNSFYEKTVLSVCVLTLTCSMWTKWVPLHLWGWPLHWWCICLWWDSWLHQSALPPCGSGWAELFLSRYVNLHSVHYSMATDLAIYRGMASLLVHYITFIRSASNIGYKISSSVLFLFVQSVQQEISALYWVAHQLLKVYLKSAMVENIFRLTLSHSPLLMPMSYADSSLWDQVTLNSLCLYISWPKVKYSISDDRVNNLHSPECDYGETFHLYFYLPSARENIKYTHEISRHITLWLV